ncbi:uncharacterized protein CLIB1423_35S00276 [[Candida] railenensis]|uniref:Aminotransferase class I/classII large domain-containing protein n=1 Tax=[Candida] railenensis TaxID=45579 RepID=A0A9P0QUD3_9ASCO|nr:uncharacterized protein CLIB1423_35S00276 [[Candida] railenensis]
MPETINFLKGHPTHSLLPTAQIAETYKKVLLDSDYLDYETDPLNQHPLSYGTDPGNYDVRQSIGKWNDRNFNRLDKPSDPDAINLTGGASYGFINILNSTTEVGEVTQRAFIVSPCYYLINGAFIDAGFEGKITAVEETPDANAEYEVDIDFLEAELIKYSEGLPAVTEETNIVSDPCGRGESKLYRFVLYIVPTFSNPGGLTYSLKTRSKLIELARKYDVLIISDDVYELLDYHNAAPIPRIVYLDRDTASSSTNKFGNSVSNATFSKLAAPGLRSGWQETTTPFLAKQLARSGPNKSGGTPGQLASLVVASFIDSGEIDTIIAKFKSVYKSRAQKLREVITKYFPASTKLYGGDGGYFFWLTFQNDTPEFDHRKINKILLDEHNIIVASGDSFEVNGDRKGWGKNSVRLSISLLSEEQIEKGIQVWAEVLKKEYPSIY